MKKQRITAVVLSSILSFSAHASTLGDCTLKAMILDQALYPDKKVPYVKMALPHDRDGSLRVGAPLAGALVSTGLFSSMLNYKYVPKETVIFQAKDVKITQTESNSAPSAVLSGLSSVAGSAIGLAQDTGDELNKNVAEYKKQAEVVKSHKALRVSIAKFIDLYNVSDVSEDYSINATERNRVIDRVESYCRMLGRNDISLIDLHNIIVSEKIVGPSVTDAIKKLILDSNVTPKQKQAFKVIQTSTQLSQEFELSLAKKESTNLARSRDNATGFQRALLDKKLNELNSLISLGN